MIQCPKCSHQLPDWSQVCQFCQADLKGVARPKPDSKQMRPAMPGTAPWIWPAYYIVSAYFLLGGVADIIQAIISMGHKTTALEGPSVFSYVAIIIGAITALIGIGLMAKVEIVRGIVNIFCWIRIATGLLSLPATIGLAVIFGPFGILLTIMSIFNIVSAGLMIYLIGETD
jgi:hypothetical protein